MKCGRDPCTSQSSLDSGPDDAAHQGLVGVGFLDGEVLRGLGAALFERLAGELPSDGGRHTSKSGHADPGQDTPLSHVGNLLLGLRQGLTGQFLGQ